MMTMRRYDQRGWHDRWTATPDPRIVVIWATCDICWGQRFIMIDRRCDPCPRCLGIGQRMKIIEESKCA